MIYEETQHYATIMKSLAGAMDWNEVWESFYSKNGGVWTILNAWWLDKGETVTYYDE